MKNFMKVKISITFLVEFCSLTSLLTLRAYFYKFYSDLGEIFCSLIFKALFFGTLMKNGL